MKMRTIKSLGGFRAGLLLVVSVTFAIYLSALKNDFVWDDYSYIFENMNIRSINLNFVKWSFTDTATGHWIPLTLFSFALDHAVWGLNPAGYHLTNIILHSLNVLLVFILAIKIFQLNSSKKSSSNKALITGIVTALLFGIHPLHVESVAWATERKDVLSTFFFLLSLLSYTRYTYSEGLKRRIYYNSSLFLFMIALMSKPMAISLPIILIILDSFALKRLTEVADLQKILIEKLPFFGLSILSAALTVWAAHSVGTLETLEKVSFTQRTFVVAWAYVFYLIKMLLPFNLSPLYPYPQTIDIFTIRYFGSVMLFLLITFFSYRVLTRRRVILAVWMFYVVTLIPVIGIIQAGPQVAADRYTYLPSLGPFFLTGIGVAMFIERCSKNTFITHNKAAVIGGVILIMFSMITVQRNNVWYNDYSLWSDTVLKMPDNGLAHNNLGVVYSDLAYVYDNSTWYDEAIQHFQTAIRLIPNFSEGYGNMGNVYAKQGKIDEAIKQYQAALRLAPEDKLARQALESLNSTKAAE